MKVFEFAKKPSKCPVCTSKRIAKIRYGLVPFSVELEEQMATGKIVLGGCVISDNDPKWTCTDCDAVFFKQTT